MTDSSDIAAKAREALEGITSDWPPALDGYDEMADAAFVAAAPDLVRSLLAALETAETERDRTIRNLLDMCVMADVIDEGYAAEVSAALGGVS